jgi:SAM-dependent methyltransferase
MPTDTMTPPTSARTYQDASGPYQLPNDAQEHQRLNAQSEGLIALMHGQPFHAPLQAARPTRILDIGCGTGAMTALLAEKYPEAEVIGIDIAPVPETGARRRDNVTYVQGDIRALARDGHDPRFQPGSFDYIFERLLILGMTDWPGHVASVATLLRPGGWMEFHEMSLELRKGGRPHREDSWEFWKNYVEDVEAVGLDPMVGGKLKGLFAETAGLRDVRESLYHINLSSSVERPELMALEGQIRPMFGVMIEKTCGPRRSPEVLERMRRNKDEVFEKGIEDGVGLQMYAVAGQKPE